MATLEVFKYVGRVKNRLMSLQIASCKNIEAQTALSVVDGWDGWLAWQGNCNAAAGIHVLDY